MSDADVIFTAETVGGQALTVHAPDDDRDTLFVLSDDPNDRRDFYLNPDHAAGLGDVLRGEHGSLIELLHAEVERLRELKLHHGKSVTDTRTEWTMRVRYVDGRPDEDGQPMAYDLARMAVDGLNQVESAEFRDRAQVDRAELVNREVRATADGWKHIGPWVAVEKSGDAP